MRDIFLKPGEIAFSTSGDRITTILGSCIAVCMYDKKRKTGGMCHYYLPESEGGKGHLDNKYGNHAIVNLLKEFKRNGSSPSDIVAKIIGAGEVIDVTIPDVTYQVGPNNIRIAKEVLGKFKIKIVAESTGGKFGRKIRFYADNGSIEMRKLNTNSKELEQTNKKIASEFKLTLPKFKKPAAPAPASRPTATQPPKKIGGPINVLIVDDSSSMRMILKKMISRDPKLKVMGEAENPVEAEKIMKETRPDVITLDINMPIMDGVTFLKKYMPVTPIPTVMISSISKAESGPVFDALENGAFDYIKKPSLDEIDNLAAEINDVIKAAAESKYIQKQTHDTSKTRIEISSSKSDLEDYLIAIGASTGGTEAIKDVLIHLPSNVPPIVITQHIPPVFSAAFAERLNQLCKFQVKEAVDGDILEAGKGFVAPGGRHMKIIKKGGVRRIHITDDPPVNRFRPSVDYMFNSIKDFASDKVISVLMTGMGSDGAKELLSLKGKDVYTIAQDEKTSVVYGMPKAAVEMGAARVVSPLHEIANEIGKYLGKHKKR